MGKKPNRLLENLDEFTETERRRGRTVTFAISGGDSILHPKFWEFAEELHRRGHWWIVLGNPFHLTEENCKRLHGLGCTKYQLSLDGLESFHDHLRKPGSR